MPNWCDNVLVVFGPPSDVQRFRTAVRDSSRELVFDKIVTMPNTPDKYPDWYEWAYENWGVKWDLDDSTICNDAGPGMIIYDFQTAWGPPLEFLQNSSRLWPSLTFGIRYEEPGNGVKGKMFVGYHQDCSDNAKESAETAINTIWASRGMGD